MTILPGSIRVSLTSKSKTTMNIDCKAECRWRSTVIFLLLGLLPGGCASIRSGSHHDESASIEAYRSFNWIADNHDTTDFVLACTGGTRGRIDATSYPSVYSTSEIPSGNQQRESEEVPNARCDRL